MPQTSFLVGYSSIGLSDENKMDSTSSCSNPVVGPAAQWLALLSERLGGLVGLPLEGVPGEPWEGSLGHRVSVLLHWSEASGPCLWLQKMLPAFLTQLILR